MNKQAEIMRLVAALGEYYDKPLTPTQIAAYTEDLLCLEPGQLAQAIVTYRNDPRHDRFPLPVKLKAMIGAVVNPDDEAVQIVGRIVLAMSRIGYYRSDEAKVFIGDIGWRVVQADGGWENVCQTLTEDLPIRKAQWRNLAKSFLESPRERLLALELKPQNGLKQIGLSMVLKEIPKDSA